jgi:hypothetical protein
MYGAYVSVSGARSLWSVSSTALGSSVVSIILEPIEGTGDGFGVEDSGFTSREAFSVASVGMGDLTSTGTETDFVNASDAAADAVGGFIEPADSRSD